MTISVALIFVILFVWFLFRKSIARITRVAPEIATIGVVNLHRAAVIADRHAAVAAVASAFEANDEAEELCQQRGIAFNGDPIDLYDAVVKPHDYSSSYRKPAKAQPQP